MADTYQSQMRAKQEILQSVWTKAGSSVQSFVSAIKEDKCNACGNCAQVCPRNVFRFAEKSNGDLVAIIAYKDNCVGCGSCLQVCPHKALQMQTKKITEPINIKSDKISGLTFGATPYIQGFLLDVDPAKCNGCARCVWACSKSCYEMSIVGNKLVARPINKEKCLGDGACHRVCPTNAIVCSSLNGAKLFIKQPKG